MIGHSTIIVSSSWFLCQPWSPSICREEAEQMPTEYRQTCRRWCLLRCKIEHCRKSVWRHAWKCSFGRRDPFEFTPWFCRGTSVQRSLRNNREPVFDSPVVGMATHFHDRRATSKYLRTARRRSFVPCLWLHYSPFSVALWWENFQLNSNLA